MTDKDIIKALECCGTATCISNSCPYEKIHDIPTCTTKLTRDALDLINRQQETIETLRGCIERHHIIRKDGKSPLSLLTAEIRAEAIKEFAERLKQKIFVSPYDVNLFAPYTDNLIDNLVKEMSEPTLLDKKMVGEQG